MYIDRRYDHQMFRAFLATVWYPLFYWTLNWLVSVAAFPRAMFLRRRGKRGRWVTTDRGVAENDAKPPVPPLPELAWRNEEMYDHQASRPHH
jgi:hypothetical protein